jgi:hypothetical protein
MKKIGFLMIAAFLITGGLLGQVKKTSPTEVYYFHMTRRCNTCQTVEKVTEEAMNEFFVDAIKKGEVAFRSVNLEDKENKELVKKLKVQGQSLLIVNGKEKIDITDKGFLYAVNEPAKLKAEIKTSVEKFAK